MKKSDITNLTPTQKVVKQPHRCIYEGPNKNTDPDLARDVITLYVTCKMGYSPIRHILGLKTDKKIENIIRQHMFGRIKIKNHLGELRCPGSKDIEELYKGIIISKIQKYKTQDDPYIIEMLATGKWKDDPVQSKVSTCKQCNKPTKPDWKLCPFCGNKLHEDTQRKLW